MASNNIIGYVGGLAIAAGVGAAVMVASQGTAHADTDAPDSATATESTNDVDAGPKKPDTPTGTERPGPVSEVGNDVGDVGDVSDITSSGDNFTIETRPASTSGPTTSRVKTPTAEEFEAAQVERLQNLYRGTRADSSVEAGPDSQVEEAAPAEVSEQAASVVEAVEPQDVSTPTGREDTGMDNGQEAATPAAATAADDPTAATDVTAAEETDVTAAEDVPWSPNPFRPMPPEPAPNDMPGVIWSLEEAIINIWSFLPPVQPFAREGVELVYRASQTIPWVNVVVPLSNVLADLPAALGGDKNASQRIINNLVITIHPLAIAYYGYNELADLANLEQPALEFQTFFFATIWNILDPFQLLHNGGAAGLPLSTTTPPPYPPTEEPSG